AFDKHRANVDPLRIAVVLGSSTSGIDEGAVAISECLKKGNFPDTYDYGQQEMATPAEFLAEYLAIKGPAYVISTACSSSAKALASARRLLRLNVCDLVIAGGVDSLCKLTVQGFSALEQVSTERCLPFSVNRNGINIGEGAALFLMSREPGPVSLLGVGECSDGHHISAPDPSAAGAIKCMSQALNDSALVAEDIDYVNLHGTATQQNDAMEAKAVHEVFGASVPCSSTKPYTGHCLGAAGAIEAGLCWLSLCHQDNCLPLHRWDGKQDEGMVEISFIEQQFAPSMQVLLSHVLSNSFAFGGNNISLIMGNT
ncbi:MAG: beta-ketoacyl-ACP synthase, partial [Planctomycetes bacterium]|nr:beta-ketoacyl-ACP synthase [Planctomycetota bacterium]